MSTNPLEQTTMRQNPVRPFTTLAVSVMLSVAMLGCGSDTPTAAADQVGPAGVWTFGIVVTSGTGICTGEVGESSAHPITITITSADPSGAPYSVTASGFLGVPNNILTGTFDTNNRLVISGSYPEGGGTTSPTHDLVATSANRMEGTETWNWTSADGSCPNSKSDVTADRIQ